ncbi:MAG: VTT domain-containing protein [Propionibacteriaceae bacterium]|nr:VTT domain-containing protein [Propionibacteriaceae bacterium]
MSDEQLFEGDEPPHLEIPLADKVEAPVALPEDAEVVEGEVIEAREWWDDPGLPWRQKPTKKDFTCIGMISFVAIYSLVMLPLQPVILGLAPQISGALGYRLGMVGTGALASQGDTWWPLVLIIGSAMGMKFDWVYWWAGKLWGRGIIEVWSGKSERARRRNERAEKIARKYETVAIFISYLPIPIPVGVIYAVLGEAGTTLKKFLIVDYLSSVVFSGIYIYLGFCFGETVIGILEVYIQYMWYISIGLLVVIIAIAVINARKNAKAQSSDAQ